MAYPQTPNDFCRGRRMAIVAILGGLWTIGPFPIGLYLPAPPAPGDDLAGELGVVAGDMTVC